MFLLFLSWTSNIIDFLEIDQVRELCICCLCSCSACFPHSLPLPASSPLTCSFFFFFLLYLYFVTLIAKYIFQNHIKSGRCFPVETLYFGIFLYAMLLKLNTAYVAYADVSPKFAYFCKGQTQEGEVVVK